MNTLSAEIEDVKKSYEFVIAEARSALDGELDTIKYNKREMPDGKFLTETTTVPHDDRLRLSYLKLIVDTSKMLEQLNLGRTLDISAASVHLMVKDLKKDKMNLKSRLIKYESLTGDEKIGTDKKFIIPRND